MKYILLALMLSCPYFVGQVFLYAVEDWYQPQIHSNVYSSFCEDPLEQSIIAPEYYGYKTMFAVSSFDQFKNSVHGYFNQKDCDGIFFRYVPSHITGKDTVRLEVDRGMYMQYVPLYPTQDLMIRILGGVDYSSRENQNYLFLYKGLKMKARLSDHFSLDGYWWAGHFNGDRKYYIQSSLIDGFVQPDDDTVYLDNLQGAIKYNHENIHASLGRGKFQVGDNISGSIILDNAVNDYGYFASKLIFGKLSLSYMHGALTPDENEEVDSTRVDKFIVLHKLDWILSNSFSGFLGEEIIYGNRSLDLNYMLPHAFWRIIEHNLEDRDNVLIFGGVHWNINKDLTFYENTLFDEFSQSKILTDWWGSKYALQAGVSYHTLKRFPNSDNPQTSRFTIEMTAIRPWTYTHFIKWNKFSNDDIALGYPLGSNLLSYAAELDYPLRNNVLLGVHSSYTRQGSTGNQFSLNTSDPALIPDIENTKTRWLAGDITDTTRLKVMLEWKPLFHHSVRIGSTLSKIEDLDWAQEFTVSYRTEF